MEQHLIAYFIGIFIIFSSHAYMLYKPNEKIMTMEQHCYINIIAALLIAYYFMFNEKYISF
jgi:hypothetical protein